MAPPATAVDDEVFAVPVGWRAVAAAPLHALRDTAATPALARTQGAWALICIATWTYAVAVAVYAFRAGGAAGASASPSRSARFRRSWPTLR